MIPDHLQSALEAIVAMSFLDGDVESETVSMNSSHMLARRTCSALTDETTQDQSVQSTSNSRNGKALDECYSSQLSARPQLSTVAEHNHSVSEKKGLSYNPNVVDSEVAPRLVLPAHPLRFLIVDDSAMNRRMLRRLLSTHNYYIVEATDGKDCLKVWTDSASMGNAIDVVLIDNIMPTMSG